MDNMGTWYGRASQVARGEESACRRQRQETWVQSLGQEDSLEEEIATCSSNFAWKILWTEDPGGHRP